MIYSPLRYPGGKRKLAPFIGMLIEEYGHKGGTYIEPFAGGAAVAIELLEKEIVSRIVINDFDKGVYSFWRAILTETDRFVEEIERIPLSVEEWNNQHDICMNSTSKYSFELGFATFYMNRTNRSGIIKGGIIGGKNQDGIWKMDARFNKIELINRIRRIASMKRKIHLYNQEIERFLSRFIDRFGNDVFVYFDPPYFNQGKQLYLNFFRYEDHIRIERLINEHVNYDWIITYDDVPQIEKIYQRYCVKKFEIRYSAAKKRTANEIIVFKSQNMIPSNELMKHNNLKITLS